MVPFPATKGVPEDNLLADFDDSTVRDPDVYASDVWESS